MPAPQMGLLFSYHFQENPL
ncbi:MAG: hypothetical protein ACXWIN_00845 [Burkholderiaceae bacterium]